MHYRIVAVDETVILKLSGEVNVPDWRCCFEDTARFFKPSVHQKLLIDGGELYSFDVTHSECQQLALNFVEFAPRGAFYASNPLIFGMFRVIHSYSNNERFGICKTKAEALEFLRQETQEKTKPDIGLSLLG